MSRRRILGALAPVVVVLAATIAFAVFEPIQVLPRIRVAPGYRLVDAEGRRLTSEDLRGSITLYTFGHPGCGDACAPILDTVREVLARLDEVELPDDVSFRVVTISLEPLDEPELAAFAAELGADGDRWTVATGEPDHLVNVVRGGFRTWYEATDDGIVFDPTLVLVDGWGVVRGDYRYRTQASDADRIVRHLQVLTDEIRNARGAAAIAYEAAHLFLCYP